MITNISSFNNDRTSSKHTIIVGGSKVHLSFSGSKEKNGLDSALQILTERATIQNLNLKEV